MIYDVFMFNDEFAMLDCRLQQAQGHVDQMIAIEGNRTMAGEPKPYHLTEAQKDGKYPWLIVEAVDLDDISGLELPELKYVTPETLPHWKRDLKQRSGVDPLLWDLDDDDIVITGDLDEIPMYGPALSAFDGEDSVLKMELLVYSARWRVSGAKWLGTNISLASSIRGKDAGMVRRSRLSRGNMLDNGWHLAWFGGPQAIYKKVHQFAHAEMVPEADDAAFKRLGQRMTPDGKRQIVPYRGLLPDYVAEGMAPDEWYA